MLPRRSGGKSVIWRYSLLDVSNNVLKSRNGKYQGSGKVKLQEEIQFKWLHAQNLGSHSCNWKEGDYKNGQAGLGLCADLSYF